MELHPGRDDAAVGHPVEDEPPEKPAREIGQGRRDRREDEGLAQDHPAQLTGRRAHRTQQRHLSSALLYRQGEHRGDAEHRDHDRQPAEDAGQRDDVFALRLCLRQLCQPSLVTDQRDCGGAVQFGVDLLPEFAEIGIRPGHHADGVHRVRRRLALEDVLLGLLHARQSGDRVRQFGIHPDPLQQDRRVVVARDVVTLVPGDDDVGPGQLLWRNGCADARLHQATAAHHDRRAEEHGNECRSEGTLSEAQGTQRETYHRCGPPTAAAAWDVPSSAQAPRWVIRSATASAVGEYSSPTSRPSARNRTRSA